MKKSILVLSALMGMMGPVQAHSLSALPAGLTHELLHVLPVVGLFLLASCLLKIYVSK